MKKLLTLKNNKPGYSILRFSLLLLVLYGFSVFPDVQATSIQESEVGHRIGVSVSAETLAEMDADILFLLEETGISVIEIEGVAPEPLVERLRETTLFLFIKQNRRFTTPVDFEQNEERFWAQDQSLIQFYKSRLGERVTAFGLFHYPLETSPLMQDRMNRYIGRLQADRDPPLSFYYQSFLPNPLTPMGPFTFRSSRYSPYSQLLNTSVVHFYAGDAAIPSLIALRELLRKTLERDQSIVILELEWLLEQIDRFDLLTNALQTYASNQEILFPLPSPPDPDPSPNWMVIFLVVVLATYFFHYRFHPIYKRSLFRYFTAHKFFVEDVMDHRLRSPVTGMILFLQHVLLCGLFAWSSVQILFTSLGLEALFHHFPFLGRFGTNSFTFFIWGTIAGGILQTLSVLWIHLPNRKTRSFGQTLNLYTWPLHLNLLTILFLVTIYQSGDLNGWILYAIFFLFLFIWINSFNIAAFDCVRFLSRYRMLYLFSTAGIHSILALLVLIYLYTTSSIWQPLQLALSLP
ncbi:MAG: hypothetical protein WD599_03170 [Balneolaceae bacterium]